jgi:hypothetical protein
MEERRKHKRFPVQLSTRCLGGSEEEWVNCSVANVSREVWESMCTYKKESIQVRFYNSR